MAPTRDALNPAALPIGRELARKALHLSAVVLPVAYSMGVPRTALLAVLAAASIIAVSVEMARRSSARAAASFDRFFGTIIRERERREVTGATWLALSCLVVVAVLSRNAAIASLWCATVGDPVAAIVGRSWTFKTTSRGDELRGKTVAGTVGCLVASFAGVWVVAGYLPPQAIVVAIAAAAAEAMPVRIDDNVRVSVAAGIAAQIFA